MGAVGRHAALPLPPTCKYAAPVIALAPLDTDVAVEPPEHIVFRHRVAGPARRFLAYLIDLILCYVAFTIMVFVVVVLVVGFAGVTNAFDGAIGSGGGLMLVVLFAIQWAYFAVLEGWTGRTPGKRALDLRVVT